jgi:hypothetical protein
MPQLTFLMTEALEQVFLQELQFPLPVTTPYSSIIIIRGRCNRLPQGHSTQGLMPQPLTRKKLLTLMLHSTPFHKNLEKWGKSSMHS